MPHRDAWQYTKGETMDDAIKAFTRQTLKDGLAQCTEAQQLVFKQMYSEPIEPSPHSLPPSPEVVARIRAVDIEDVVDAMPDDSLGWAIQQVEATLTKAAKKQRNE